MEQIRTLSLRYSVWYQYVEYYSCSTTTRSSTEGTAVRAAAARVHLDLLVVHVPYPSHTANRQKDTTEDLI